MSISRALRIGLLSTVLSVVAVSSASAMDCQMLLIFGGRRDGYDKPTHDRIQKWLRAQSGRVKYLKSDREMDGGRSLCIVAQDTQQLGSLFEGIKTELIRNPPAKGTVELIGPGANWVRPDPSPDPSKVKGSGYGPSHDRGIPRDNAGKGPG